MKKKVRDIIIDGDIIVHIVAKNNMYKDDIGGKPLKSKIDMKPYQEHFKRIVEDWVLTAEVESICYNWTIGEVKVIISGQTNFRYDIYPDYKKDRIPHVGVMKKLKKWAKNYYIEAKGCEADDVIAYFVRKGGIGFSFDKDLIYGVAGKWFDVHYSRLHWVKTSKKQAEHFFKCQILAGDGVDGIPSIEGVGLKTAEKLLAKYGNSYEDIVSIFKDKTKVLGKKPREESYSKKYMVTMTRLVCMSQWSPKKGIKLWKLK